MTATTTASCLTRIAEELATPPPATPAWHAQSLSRGTAGTALLHLERARSGHGPWHRAHTWVRAATTHPVLAGTDTSLYLGAPAVATLLHTASENIPSYAAAATTLHESITADTHRRVDLALQHLQQGSTHFSDYDLFRGLTGTGRLLLDHAPGDDALARVLDYLVRLTHPKRDTETTLPGWWAAHDPDPALPTPGGHANHGLAHGIAGPLALLALARRRGITVPGQREAIERILAHYDHWRHDTDHGSWWPQWITHEHHALTAAHQHGPPRPSWCYGTPGIARAHQLAALALDDTTRQRHAENALTACLTDPRQLALISDNGLCHGWAGLYQTSWRIAGDARSTSITHHLSTLPQQLTSHLDTITPTSDPGFLTGTAGTALALHTALIDTPPRSGWDACLLLS
ncbi:Lanthionine synthetase C-like protein [Actinopolyspora alba]|uniref:Lanthionine synthetase C-like protein n=1 Tax=Actinopolyspora alba TaxID=673379 RepID=A0A1I2CHZ9_9ACTN|nr:lanthionine synthetase C family protein [Actinopolyspora alba]SFE67772.1 Lanthionine synthetase C-like protein [Actinopolyspora alba]